MKTLPFLIIFSFIITLKPVILNGQNIPAKIKNYVNGNILIEQNGKYELKSKEDKSIGSWDFIGPDIYIKNQPYKRVLKMEGIIKKQGIFNSENGELIVPVIYDNFRALDGLYAGIIFTQIEKKFGLIQFEKKSFIPTIYESINYHPNGNLLLVKDRVAFMINEKLQIVDSIVGFKNSRNLSFRRETYLIAYLTNSVVLIDKKNKIIFEKGWTKIEDFSGDNLIVSTKNGYGLYNMTSRKVVEPYKYRTYKCKGYFNEQILFAENKQWKLFDSSGKQLLTIKADSVIPALDEWSGFFFQKEGKWGFIDLGGKVLQQPIWKSMWNPRWDNFDATLPNGKIKTYYYEYRQINGNLIISKVKEGVVIAAPPN
jgi:hypothetical protein